MPSFNELQRRDSWPPTIVRLHNDHGDDDTDAIDENPFSFFLTSPDDIDDFFDEEDLDAGIETPESAKSPVREISPSALQRAPLHDDEDEEENYDFGLAMPLSLKDFTTKHTSVRKQRAEQRKKDGLEVTGLGILLLEHMSKPSTRGRAKIRPIPTRGARGRGQTRSLSARRPQSWREPSPEIFSIKEERESDDDLKFEEEQKENSMPVSASAPTTGRIGPGGLRPSSPVSIPKPKKRVHWAF
jgi:hypothetical protein